jgi:hypothetical protein
MEFAVVAEHDPALCSDLGKPFVIGCGLCKLEFAPRIVVILDSKRRARRPDSLWKAFAKVTIKIER